MTAAGTRLGPADVRAAAVRIRGPVRRTPLLAADALPALFGPGQRGLLLKAEHLQHGGSFKARGAANAMLGQDSVTVVAGSSGNHGIAVAALARRIGAEATVVMAAGAGRAKADAIRRLGARVLTIDGGVAARDQRARELAEDTGALLVPSSDDELVVAGQGTVVLEILEEAPDIDLLFVPVGGGGLLAGSCLAAALAARPPRVIGVEPRQACRYAVSLEAGSPVEVPASQTVADGLRGQRPGEITFPIIQRRVDELVAVEDGEILRAMELLHRAGLPAEPSGSVALAGALRRGFHGRTAVVVSGGNSPSALAAMGVGGAAEAGPAAPPSPVPPLSVLQ
ncbi:MULTISPECIES: threonine ammonia-lyase [Streptomyces]|uniref:threonine ammonia-lyase n=1 Tax=Streptomyces TaxID=1883 RepID=UPI00055E9746|nr:MULTISPECIES: pyridoxal-phosphate dependent enzyme [unclassified Streptomyces]WJY35321.1 pyridoxal-phosphate dependent enzyme [Streptomyces sp. P9-2B-1]